MTLGVITDVRMGDVLVLVISTFVLAQFQATARDDQSIVRAETLLRTSSVCANCGRMTRTRNESTCSQELSGATGREPGTPARRRRIVLIV